MRTLLFILPWAAIGVALAIIAVGAAKGTNVFKTQTVAWLVTIVMVVVAVGIGCAAAPFNDPVPDYPLETDPPASAASFVRDEADVLSDKTVRTLNERNQRLTGRYGVVIGVVTCNYGRDNLYTYAMEQAGEMGLGGYDMIVVLDISGDNYWLIQGDKLARDFTDSDCSDYAYDYMESWFAWGDYDNAVLDLSEALEAWYGTYYG